VTSTHMPVLWRCLILAWLLVATGCARAPASPSPLTVQALDAAWNTADRAQLPTDGPAWQPQPTPQLRWQTGSRWWRVRLDDPHARRDPGPWVLSLRETYDSPVQVYLPDGSPPRTLWLPDRHLDQPGSRLRLALPLTPAQRDGWIYLRLDWVRHQPVSLAAMPQARYLATDLDRIRFFYAVLAAMLALALMAAIFAMSMQRKALVLLSLWIACIALYHLGMSGELASLLPDLAQRLSPVSFASLALHLGLPLFYLFVYRFLAINRHFPRIARYYRGLLWVVVLLLLPELIGGFTPLMALVMNGLILLLSGLILVLSAQLARRGNRQGGFFLVGWGASTLVATLRAGYFQAHEGTPPWLELLHPTFDLIAAMILLVAVARAARYAEREMHLARRVARTDPLTGAANRAELDSTLPALLDHAQRSRQPLCVLFLDLDHFKSINDRYGHDMGDCCLVETAHWLSRHLRRHDLLARFGGEEFVAVLEGTDAGQAQTIADTLRTAIKRHCQTVNGQPVGLTLSIGIAQYLPGETPQELLRRADEALYRAKAEGRDRCMLAPTPLAS